MLNKSEEKNRMEEGAATATGSVSMASPSRSMVAVYLLNEVAKTSAQLVRPLFILVGIAEMNSSNEKGKSLLFKLLVLAVVLHYMVLVLATILQFHVKTFLPLIMLTLSVGLICAVSVLALMMISPTIAWIVLALWLFIFVFMGYYYYHQGNSQIIPERIKKLIEDYGGMSTHNSVLSAIGEIGSESEIGDP